MNIDWSNAPSWATAVGKCYGSLAWISDKGYCFQGIINPPCHPYKEGEYTYEKFIVVARRPWSGEGLPPVGTVCEIHHNKLGWVRCEIVAHKVMDCGGKTHAIAWIDGDTLDQSQGIRFRTIRTPEQIVAEERANAIEDLIKVTCITHGEAARIYDAGYRKP